MGVVGVNSFQYFFLNYSFSSNLLEYLLSVAFIRNKLIITDYNIIVPMVADIVDIP